jgi:hypothetical protein
MRRINPVTALAALLCASLLPAADEKARTFPFGKEDAGKVPSGWKSDKTGKGEGSVWKVVLDKTAPSGPGFVLAQTAESPGPMFNLCVAGDTNYKDVDVTVSFKAVRGRKDQGGGIVWRYQDRNNYYVARMNPLEDNFRVYKVGAGKRTQLGSKEGLRVPAGEWHGLRVKMEGDHIECYLDGKKYLEVRDSTFTKAGKVGLWTKSDAQTRFDGFKVSGK